MNVSPSLKELTVCAVREGEGEGEGSGDVGSTEMVA